MQLPFYPTEDLTYKRPTLPGLNSFTDPGSKLSSSSQDLNHLGEHVRLMTRDQVTAASSSQSPAAMAGFKRGHDGKIAGLYDLDKTLGRGHFAVVKLARHVFTGEKVYQSEMPVYASADRLD